MSTIKFKRSSVGGKVPLVTDLDYGEMALNYADGILYYKNSSNTIASLSGGSFNTATAVAYAVTATYAATSYSLANTATTYVGNAVTATNASEIIGGTTGAILYQVAPNTTDFISIGPNGYVLTSNGTSATWQASSGSGSSFGSIITTTQGWNLP